MTTTIFGRGPTTTTDPLGEQQPNQYGYFKHVSIRPGMISSKPPTGGNAMTRSLRWVAQVDDFWRLELGSGEPEEFRCPADFCI